VNSSPRQSCSCGELQELLGDVLRVEWFPILLREHESLILVGRLGIQSLAIDFEFGRIRLPYGDVEARGQSLMLKAEATQYPHGRTDDLLMALWMLKWNYRDLWLLKPRARPNPGWGPLPPEVRGER